MSWRWLLEPKPRAKCAHCQQPLRAPPGPEHLIEYQGSEWHLECLLTRLTSNPPLTDLASWNAP